MSSNKELRQLIFSPMLKADNVIRYSCVYMSRPESLDHHIYEVCLISYVIAKKLIKHGEVIDVGKTLELGLIHDLEETITADIPRNTKHFNSSVNNILEDVATFAIEKLAIANEGFEDLPALWKNAKCGKEGIIIKIVDMLTVVRKAALETEIYGNKEALKVIIELPKHIRHVRDVFVDSLLFDKQESVQYLTLILDQALSMLSELSNKYQSYIDTYLIDESVLSANMTE